MVHYGRLLPSGNQTWFAGQPISDDLPIEFGELILGDSDSVGQLHARSSHQRQQWPLAKPTSGGSFGVNFLDKLT